MVMVSAGIRRASAAHPSRFGPSPSRHRHPHRPIGGRRARPASDRASAIAHIAGVDVSSSSRHEGVQSTLLSFLVTHTAPRWHATPTGRTLQISTKRWDPTRTPQRRGIGNARDAESATATRKRAQRSARHSHLHGITDNEPITSLLVHKAPHARVAASDGQPPPLSDVPVPSIPRRDGTRQTSSHGTAACIAPCPAMTPYEA